MPWLENEDIKFQMSRATGMEELEGMDNATFKESLRAAYRLDNTVGSFFAQEKNLPDDINRTGYNAWDSLTEEEKMDDRFTDIVSFAESPEELEAARRQFAREREDKETLSRSGIIPSLISGISDPINLIPVGGASYATYRNGYSILKGAAATAGAGAMGASIAEAGLHHTQLTREYGESAANVSVAALFGGILGAAPGAVRHMLKGSENDIAKTLDPEGRLNAGENPAFNDGSIGAAAVNNDPKIRGKLAQAVLKIMPFDPLSRTTVSDLKSTRQTVNRLAENFLDIDTPGGQSVETKIKLYDGMLYKAMAAKDKIFKEYRKEGGKMKYKEFNEEVGKAMRNEHGDPFVTRAAESFRKEVYDPIRAKSVKAGLLDDAAEVTTASNYLNRIWNQNKIKQNLPKFTDTVSRWLMHRNEGMELDDAQYLAREIAGKIIKTPDGRLPYDYEAQPRSGGSGKPGAKGMFKARTFEIDDHLVEDFLENDIDMVAGRYVKGAAPDIELTNAFGDINMTELLKEIETEGAELAAKNPAKARKIIDRANRDIGDIAAMRDRIRGVYGQVDHNNPWVRAGRVARDLNYMRLLGGVVAASIPDLGRTIMAEGIVNTFGGLAKAATNIKAFKVSAAEAKEYGIGVDALIGGRAEILADTVDYAQGGTALERGVRAAATKFSSVNLMNHWTSGMKQLHAVTMQNRVIGELMQGKYDKRLAQLGIDEYDAGHITNMLKKHAKQVDGVWIANAKNWEDNGLYEMWGAALRKESDRVIMVPGQEKPLFMSSELGKTLLQFKTFMFSSTQRVLVSSLQQQDKHYIQGMLSLVSLGMMSYAFKEWDAGRKLSDNPTDWVIEGIDRSGALGILMEMNNTLEKMSYNSAGLRPLLGSSTPSGRYASRSLSESMLGPTFGSGISTIMQVGTGLTGEDGWRDSDTRAMRRLAPGQNLSLLRQFFDKLEKEI